MSNEINPSPIESTTSPHKTIETTAAAKLSSDSRPDPTSKPTPPDQSADKAELKRLGLPDVQIVDDKTPASTTASSQTPGDKKPANEKPAAEQPATGKQVSENPVESEPAKAPQASENTTAQKSPAAPVTDSSKPPAQAAGNEPAGNEAGGAKTVIKDLYDGAENEVDNHKGRLLENAVIGAGVGLGTVALVASAPAWVPVVLISGAVAGATYEIGKHLPDWIDDIKVADKPSDYSQSQVQQATSSLNQLGGSMADNAAGFLGGMDGASFGTGLVRGLTSTVVADATGGADANAAEDVTSDLDKTPPKNSEPPANQPPEQNNPPQNKNPSDNSAPKSGNNGNQPVKSEAPTENQTAKPGNNANDRAEPSTAKSGSDRQSTDKTAPGNSPQEQAQRLTKMATAPIKIKPVETDTGLMKPVNRATVGDENGTIDTVVKPIDADNPADLGRVSKAQLETNVDRVLNTKTPGPLTVVRDGVELNGQTGLVAVQEDGGQSLGANLKTWAAQASGDSNADGATAAQVQQLIEAHPQLNQSVGEGLFQMMFRGNSDLMELSNLAVQGTQNAGTVDLDEPLNVSIIDSKMNWAPSTEPTWGLAPAIPDSMPNGVAELYAGKTLNEISPALQQQADSLLETFQSQAGRTQLEQAGLTDQEIDAATSRLQYLTTKGFPPMPDDGTPAGDYVMQQMMEQNAQYNERSQSATMQQILDTQKAQQTPDGSTEAAQG